MSRIKQNTAFKNILIHPTYIKNMTPQRKCDHVEQGKKENKDKEKAGGKKAEKLLIGL